MVENILTQENIFNVVIDAIHRVSPHTKALKNITKITRLDEDLDIQHYAVSLLVIVLEKMTHLDLDTQISSLWTVGDICNLIEQRQNDKQKSLQKIFQDKVLPFVSINKQATIDQHNK